MFQELLIESLPRKTWRVGSVLTAASLHALALGPFVWASLQTIHEIEDPPEVVPILIGRNPPPLGDGGSSDTTSRPRERLAPIPRATAQQYQLQPERETSLKQATSDDIQDHDESNVRESEQETTGGGGSRSGVDGGTGKDERTPVDMGEDALSPERVDQSPLLISRIDPQYPEGARKNHLSGIVVLQAIIDSSGRVADLRVAKSAGALLDDAALTAVAKWVYRPAMLDGRPVSVRLSVRVDFTLH